MFELSQQKQELLKESGNIIILGGPGSGKTTIALLKANYIIEKEELKDGQNVVFLSFARATVARVEQQTGILASRSIRKRIEINTYHGFTWNILRSFGYLLKQKFPFQLLTPPEAAARLAGIKGKEARKKEKLRLIDEEALLHFDLFANIAIELLSRSNSLLTIISDSYPVIILDEFQDTNEDEWNFIKLLGRKSRLIALADAEQRIYEFRGADPKRISDFIKEFQPKQYDFGFENNRSDGTDILQFGNDLLTGENKIKAYQDVYCIRYPFRRGQGIHLDLKLEVIKSCRRLINLDKDNWSIAILLPTKNLMLDVSKFLLSKQTLANGTALPEINHEVALETAGPSLAAIVIGGLLENNNSQDEIADRLIRNLCEHIRGRKGDEPANQHQLSLSNALLDFLESRKVRGKNRKICIDECFRIANECKNYNLSGNPAEDWVSIRNMLINSKCNEIKQIAIDAQYLRLLGKGAQLRSSLGELWRNYGNYSGATKSVRDSLLKEHFVASTRVWAGIQVMTMHKAKGKEFDEVIVYEGLHQGKIANNRNLEQSRLNLRVSVTRAMKRATILTPASDICEFLV